MNITPQDTTTQPISDDQDLAKALAGVLPDEPEAPADSSALGGLQFEETPGLPVIQLPTEEPTVAEAPAVVAPEPEITPEEEVTPVLDTPPSGLDTIKNKALDELRPLIDRATLPAEEKFDTYLMLIRSTDDASLIEPAHEAAQSISDETRKAEALIDIIKEIDYLSKKSAQ
ncbi:hypothetical protein KI440_04085 [Candidatus Saccharibacteria bacterium TM7i]|nr:hypothetical protein KI440_04085 [Candidatus Saccharibacteria bacterium TM7i]